MNQYSPFHFAISDEAVLEQKTCMAYITGYDYIETAVNKMV